MPLRWPGFQGHPGQRPFKGRGLHNVDSLHSEMPGSQDVPDEVANLLGPYREDEMDEIWHKTRQGPVRIHTLVLSNVSAIRLQSEPSRHGP